MSDTTPRKKYISFRQQSKPGRLIWFDRETEEGRFLSEWQDVYLKYCGDYLPDCDIVIEEDGSMSLRLVEGQPSAGASPAGGEAGGSGQGGADRVRVFSRLERRTHLVSGFEEPCSIHPGCEVRLWRTRVISGSKWSLGIRPGYKVTLMDYGEGDAEVSWGKTGTREGRRTVRGESKKRELNIERSVRRAKAMVRRKAMAAGLDHLLSLTYRENMQDLERGWKDFEKFIRSIHEKYPDWKYVVVPELQKRGAIHFHLAVKGFQDVTLLRKLWRDIVGQGNIDVQYRKSGPQWKKGDLARYLAKYVGKGLFGELNKKKYRCSLKIEIPVKAIWLAASTKAKDYALRLLETVAGRVSYVWLPEESNEQYGWACAWG